MTISGCIRCCTASTRPLKFVVLPPAPCLQRCLWRIVPKDSSPSEGAQGEGGTQLTRYFLVEYAKYTPQK